MADGGQLLAKYQIQRSKGGKMGVHVYTYFVGHEFWISFKNFTNFAQIKPERNEGLVIITVFGESYSFQNTCVASCCSWQRPQKDEEQSWPVFESMGVHGMYLPWQVPPHSNTAVVPCWGLVLPPFLIPSLLWAWDHPWHGPIVSREVSQLFEIFFLKQLVIFRIHTLHHANWEDVRWKFAELWPGPVKYCTC